MGICSISRSTSGRTSVAVAEITRATLVTLDRRIASEPGVPCAVATP